MESVTKTFEITATKHVMKRFEKFLALLHFNSSFGHSNHFAMFLDGDGPEELRVKGLSDEYRYEVDLIGGVGRDIEIACDDCFTARNFRKDQEHSYSTHRAAHLIKDGKEIRKTYPTVL